MSPIDVAIAVICTTIGIAVIFLAVIFWRIARGDDE